MGFFSSRSSESKGLILLVLTFISLLALFSYDPHNSGNNWMGILGDGYAAVLVYLLGLNVYLVLGFVGWIGWNLLLQKRIEGLAEKTVLMIVFVSSISILLNVVAEKGVTIPKAFQGKVVVESIPGEFPLNYDRTRINLGGVPFYYLYRDLPYGSFQKLLSDLGVIITFTLTALVSFLFFNEMKVIFSLKDFIQRRWLNREELLSEGIAQPVKNSHKLPEWSEELYKGSRKPEIHIRTVEKEEPPQPKVPRKIIGGGKNGYKLPPPSLLSNSKKVDQPSLKKELEKQALILEETLNSFGIEAKVQNIHCGPTIVSFEVHPAVGVKVHRITALENDIALNLQAKSIRIIAPIPGKAAIGIEIPSPYPQEVSFKEMLIAYQQSGKKLDIPLILGKSVTGNNVISDLAKMPHCLIAGATGSGKSVCINTMILSILMNATPDEIKLILIDPKKVELAAYANLPHLLAPVITEPHGAYAALNWMVQEMLSRYEILKRLKLRNIGSFNSREIDKEFETSLSHPGLEIPERMPFIVAIIDEFADLMMASSADLETPVVRIAQMARAVGIHLVLATQRPSREIITGLIKSNFPARIALKVSGRVNSQIILDENGAETLLGNGDQLFKLPGSSFAIRSQTAYNSDENIRNVVEFSCSQALPNHLISSFDCLSQEEVETGEIRDALYEKAKQVVIGTQNASTTFLQRKFKIGYARAASLIDELEARGVVSPPIGGKARKVLMDTE